VESETISTSVLATNDVSVKTYGSWLVSCETPYLETDFWWESGEFRESRWGAES
jgi:hypothetical protein